MTAGQHVTIVAQHDTYGISFALEASGQPAQRQLVPIWVRFPCNQLFTLCPVVVLNRNSV